MPAMTPTLYAGGLRAAMGGGVTGGRDLDSDTFKATLHTNSYTPTVTHAFQSDLTNELATAGGYTAGGVTLTGVALTVVAANSWTTTHAVSTAFTVGRVVRPSTGNGYLYQVVVAGTTAASAPTWPTTVGATVTDGTVTWANIGRAAIKFTCSDISWSTFTAGPFRHAVIADTTPGSSATNPLIIALSYADDQTGGGLAHTITPDAGTGLFVIGIP